MTRRQPIITSTRNRMTTTYCDIPEFTHTDNNNNNIHTIKLSQLQTVSLFAPKAFFSFLLILFVLSLSTCTYRLLHCKLSFLEMKIHRH